MNITYKKGTKESGKKINLICVTTGRSDQLSEKVISFALLSALLLNTVSVVHAGDTAECNNIDCSTNIRSVYIRSTLNPALTPKAKSTPTADATTSDSKSDNVVILDYIEPNSANTTQPLVNYALGAFSKNATDELKNNKVLIKNGRLTRFVFGARSVDANVTSNRVEILGGEVGNNAVGGRSRNGNVYENEVNITGGNVLQDVFGGFSYNAEAIKNRVVITGGLVGKKIHGGSGDKLTSENMVRVSNINDVEEVVGGLSWKDNATKNSVSLNNTTITSQVIGGRAEKGNVTDNIVNISSSKVGDPASWSGEIYAGYSKKGNASKNTLNIDDGVIGFYSYAGYSEDGDANDNVIMFTSGIAGNHMHSGYSNNGGDANRNLITINGGTAKWSVFGGFSWEGEANQNVVTLKSGNVDMGLYGAKTPYDATENIVNVDGGVIGNTNTVMGASGGVWGAKVQSLGANGSSTGNATSNTVNFNAGELRVERLIGGETEQGNASKNVVNITGGTVIDHVYGGFSLKGNATDNVVTIKNSPIFGAETILHGGGTDESTPTTGNIVDGNTLNLHSKNIKVNTVKHFENLNFYLQSSVAVNDTILLLNDDTDISSVNLGLRIDDGANHKSLNIGEEIILIQAVKGKKLITSSANMTVTNANIQGGKDIPYGFVVEKKDERTLVMRRTAASVSNTSASIPSLSWLGLLTLLMTLSFAVYRKSSK